MRSRSVKALPKILQTSALIERSGERMTGNVIDRLFGPKDFSGQAEIFMRCVEGDPRKARKDYYSRLLVSRQWG
jgi:hypothetical protein